MSPTSLSGPGLKPESGEIKRIVLLLHGLGSNGDDLISLAPMLAEELPDTLFISPNAPFPFDMAPFGYQWFSLTDRDPVKMLAGVKQAAPILDATIDGLCKDFDVTESDIALLGFSQGTMTALYTGLRRAKPLAGIVGFSGALIGAETLTNNGTPVCLIHGEQDEVVPYAALAMAKQGLEDAGVSVETHARPNLPHSIDMEGIEFAQAFLRRCFKL